MTELIPPGSGRTRAVWLPGDGLPGVTLAEGPGNTWVYSWAHVVVSLAADADPAWRPAYLYLEYQNLADSGDVVTPPSIDRADGLAYYQGLASSPDRDYARVPITLTVKGRDPDYVGTADLPVGQFNMLTFQAYGAAGTGVNGKPFTDSDNSKVYGIALAAGPVPNDPTKDVVWGREYYSTSDQWIVPATGSLQVTYALTLR